MSRIHKAKVTQSLIQCGFQLLKALSPGQYEIIWTRLCQSGPQLFFETQGADTTQPWAERHTEREREKEREKERDLARSATMAACRGSEQRRAVISVLLFRQESPFPLGSHKKQADSCCTHKGPDGPQLTLMWNYCLVNPPLNKINGAVRLQYHFVYLIRLLFHLASVPVLLAFAPSFWKLDKPLNLWTSPILGNLQTGITSHGALWFFIKMLENCVTGVKKKKKKTPRLIKRLMSEPYHVAGPPPLSCIWLWCIIDANRWQVARSRGSLPHCHWPLAPVALLGDPLPVKNTPSMLMKPIRAFESVPLMCFSLRSRPKKTLPKIIRT